jgi:hypothetical protein
MVGSARHRKRGRKRLGKDAVGGGVHERRIKEPSAAAWASTAAQWASTRGRFCLADARQQLPGLKQRPGFNQAFERA